MITASIVIYNTPLPQLTRLMECVGRSGIDRLYLIDNSETPMPDEWVRGIPNAIYHFNEGNVGYGSGHNIALRMAIDAGARYHVILNPDVYWDGDVISSLSQYMDSDSDCGLCMPKILYPDGSIQLLCKLLPRPIDLLGRRFIPWRGVRDMIDRRYELQSFAYDARMEVPSLSGCFMFLRVSVLKKTGLFDERYFMYAEDLDLCRRIGDVATTMFIPDVSVYHEYEKGSYHSRRLLKMHVSSIIKYFNKWGWLFDATRRRRNRECQGRIREKSNR